jgi:hypothetical protein
METEFATFATFATPKPETPYARVRPISNDVASVASVANLAGKPPDFPVVTTRVRGCAMLEVQHMVQHSDIERSRTALERIDSTGSANRRTR